MTGPKTYGGARKGSGRKVEPWTDSHTMIRCPSIFAREVKAFLKELKKKYKGAAHG